jgi:hypothetical protein
MTTARLLMPGTGPAGPRQTAQCLALVADVAAAVSHPSSSATIRVQTHVDGEGDVGGVGDGHRILRAMDDVRATSPCPTGGRHGRWSRRPGSNVTAGGDGDAGRPLDRGGEDDSGDNARG